MCLMCRWCSGWLPRESTSPAGPMADIDPLGRRVFALYDVLVLDDCPALSAHHGALLVTFRIVLLGFRVVVSAVRTLTFIEHRRPQFTAPDTFLKFWSICHSVLLPAQYAWLSLRLPSAPPPFARTAHRENSRRCPTSRP
jgi:hypothetical protein